MVTGPGLAPFRNHGADGQEIDHRPRLESKYSDYLRGLLYPAGLYAEAFESFENGELGSGRCFARWPRSRWSSRDVRTVGGLFLSPVSGWSVVAAWRSRHRRGPATELGVRNFQVSGRTPVFVDARVCGGHPRHP